MTQRYPLACEPPEVPSKKYLEKLKNCRANKPAHIGCRASPAQPCMERVIAAVHCTADDLMYRIHDPVHITTVNETMRVLNY